MVVYMLIRLFVCVIVFRCNKLEAVYGVSTVKGSSVQLQCPIQAIARSGERIYWNKIVGGASIQYTENTNINPSLQSELKSRLTVTGDQSAGQYYLSISDVKNSDEGTYRCALYSLTGMGQAHFFLTVINNIPTNLSIERVGLDKKVNGIEGRNLMIRCSAAGGDPVPDVKLLIAESVVKVAKQSVQFTMSSVNRSYDGQNVTCLGGYEAILFYPLNDSARIYLKLMPYPPTFSFNSVHTEETVPLVISCTSTGSRPMSSIDWLLGDSKTIITNNSTQLHTHDQVTDTYTVTSTLTYSLDRTHNDQKLICGASNEATSDHGGSVETSKTLNVRYAPDITVNSLTYTQNDSNRTIECNPSGNPDSYTYHKWQHKSKYGKLIREFEGSKTLTLPDIPVVIRYQDNGEYVCIASNGIRNYDNKLKQTGSRYVTVIAQPVFTYDTIDMVKQFGEIDKAVDINFNGYSVPKIITYIWTRDGKQITTQNSAKYQSSSFSTYVIDEIHGSEIQLDGFNVTLTIRNLTTEDFTNYTVTLINAFGSVRNTIVLEFTGIPETPDNFDMRTTSTSSISIMWDSNSGGGHSQTFYIQYRVQGSLLWTTVSAGEEGINEQRRRRTYELKKLQERQTYMYELRMFSENTARNRSNYTEVLIVFTENPEIPTSSSTVIGGVVGAVVTLGIVCAFVMGIVFFKRRKGQDKTKKKEKSYVNTGFQERQKENEYEEVENKCDVQQKQSCKTYESLGIKDRPNVYDDVDNPKGLTLSQSLCQYEALGYQDKPNIYSEIDNQKDQTSHLKKQPAETNNPKENLDLIITQGPKDNLYDNERF